jgi:hypothetical protein
LSPAQQSLHRRSTVELARAVAKVLICLARAGVLETDVQGHSTSTEPTRLLVNFVAQRPHNPLPSPRRMHPDAMCVSVFADE